MHRPFFAMAALCVGRPLRWQAITTENAFVWLKIAAPTDLLLDVVCFTNVLTYFLVSCGVMYVVKTRAGCSYNFLNS